MAGVVIIHALEDSPPAHALAEKLGALGYRTATDLTSSVLRETVEEADVVVALWSPRSAARPDLVGEAAFARGLGRLVHARMHNAPPPREFAGDPQIDLTGWKGNDDFPGWLNLQAALEGVLSAAYPRKKRRPQPEPPARDGDFGESFIPPPQAPRSFSSYDAPGYDAPRDDSQRYDAARFDEPRYDSPRPDQSRPDQSRFESPRYDDPRPDPSRFDQQRYGALPPEQARFDQPPHDARRSDQSRFDPSRDDASRLDPSRFDRRRHDAPRPHQSRFDQAPYDQPRDAPRSDQSRFDPPRYDGSRADQSRFDQPRYDAPRPDPSRYDPPRYDQPSSGRSSSTTRLALIGLLTFVVVAAVGFGGYQMIRGGQDKADAESAWTTLDKNDPLALRAFIDGEPGRFRTPAESAIEELEIAELNRAREADTVDAYRRFLAGFPDTRHSAEINGRIAMLRQSEADASLVIDAPPIISEAPTLTTEPAPAPVVEAPPEPPVDLGGPVPLSPRSANPGDESSLSSEDQIRRALTGED